MIFPGFPGVLSLFQVFYRMRNDCYRLHWSELFHMNVETHPPSTLNALDPAYKAQKDAKLLIADGSSL